MGFGASAGSIHHFDARPETQPCIEYSQRTGIPG
jgi:hypothetical protein